MLEQPEPPEQPAQPTFALWPECVPLWLAWNALQTQWLTGMEGRTGLDYAACTAWLQAHRYGPGRVRNLRAALGDLAAMERAALNAWAEQQAKKHTA